MIRQEIKESDGSLAIMIPRELAEAMSLKAGDTVRLSLVGRQLVIEPDDDTMPQDTFRRAYEAVLVRYEETFKALAEYDRDHEPPKVK